MSSSAQVVALAELLAQNPQVDSTKLEEYYTEAVLAMRDTQVKVEVEIQEITAGTATYPWPDEAVRILTVFYDDRELTEGTETTFDQIQRDWRAASGTPVQYLLHVENEDDRRIRLYPAPDTSGDPAPAQIYNHLYPQGDLVVFYVSKDLVIPDWLDLPVAMAILGKEFMRESNHCDKGLAELWLRTAAVLRGIAGPP